MHARQFNSTVISNKCDVANIFLMSVKVNKSECDAPKAGQFYMLRCWAHDEMPTLSRPISVHDYDEDSGTIYFLYEVKGDGTNKISALKKGDTLALTGPLGNGFPLEKIKETAADKPIAIVSGGIGVAPMRCLTKQLFNLGAQVHFYVGYRNFAFGTDDVIPHCERFEVATETGAVGYKGYVTDMLDPAMYGAVCVCGPDIMMQVTAKICADKGTPTWVSKEEKMACGLGACLGCTCKSSAKSGGKPLCVCKDGPVFEGSVAYD